MEEDALTEMNRLIAECLEKKPGFELVEGIFALAGARKHMIRAKWTHEGEPCEIAVVVGQCGSLEPRGIVVRQSWDAIMRQTAIAHPTVL